jgi:hypothetical protein
LHEGARKIMEYRLHAMVGLRGDTQITENRVKLVAAMSPFVILAWVALAILLDVPTP